MKKLVFLLPFFVFAACGGLDRVNLGSNAVAQGVNCDGGAGGTAGAGGELVGDGCKIETFDGSRLKKRFIAGDDGSRYDAGEWFDEKSGLVCTFQDTDIGTFCLPKHAVMDTFLDPDCSIPIYVSYGKKPQCNLPSLVRIGEYEMQDVNSCSYAKLTGFAIYSPDTSEEKTIAKWYVIDPNGPNGTMRCLQQSDDLNLGKTHVAYGVQLVGKYSEFVKGEHP